MSKYLYEGRHFRKVWRKGDLESELVVIDKEIFTTRKAGNEKLIALEAEAKRRGHTTKINLVKRGNDDSELVVYTGDTWIHENTGDRCEEYYWYRVVKM